MKDESLRQIKIKSIDGQVIELEVDKDVSFQSHFNN